MARSIQQGPVPEICQKLRYAQPHAVPRPNLRQRISPGRMCDHVGCTAVHLLRFRLSGGDAEAFLQEIRLPSVSNLSAHLPRDAMRSATSPRPVRADELGRCGAEHGAGELCVGAALTSHGRSHRFDPCHAHQRKRFQVSLQQAVCQRICQKMGLGVAVSGRRRSIRAAGRPRGCYVLSTRISQQRLPVRRTACRPAVGPREVSAA
jgi:hypothetical protein